MTTVPFPHPDDLSDRIDVVVDPDASEGDVLPVLARLLIDLATKRNGPPRHGGPSQVFPTPDTKGAFSDALYTDIDNR